MSGKRLDDPCLFDFIDFLTSENVELMTSGQLAAYIALLAAEWRDGKLPGDVRLLAIRASSGVRVFTVEDFVGAGGSLEEPAPGSVWEGLSPCYKRASDAPSDGTSNGASDGTSYAPSYRPSNERIAMDRAAWIAQKDLSALLMALKSKSGHARRAGERLVVRDDLQDDLREAVQTVKRARKRRELRDVLPRVERLINEASDVVSYEPSYEPFDGASYGPSYGASAYLLSFPYKRERDARARARDSLSPEAPDGAGTKAAGEDLEAAGLTEDLWTQRVKGCPKAKGAVAWIAELEMAKEASQAYGGEAVRELYRLAVAGEWVEIPWDRLDRITARREANGGNGSVSEDDAPTVTRQAAEAYFERERERMLAESPPDHLEGSTPDADVDLEDGTVDAEELARRREQAGRIRAALLKAAGVATEDDEAEEQEVEPDPDPSAAKVSKAKRYKKLSESKP